MHRRKLEYLPILGFALLGILAAQHLRLAVTSPDADLPTWRGAPVWKTPAEMWVLQELVYQVKPDVIVETGTYKGGTALYFGTLLDWQGRGKVFSIDVRDWQPRPNHDRVSYLIGSSTAPEIVRRVRNSIPPGSVVLVDLDSAHFKSHVLTELRTYSELVSVGSYIVVEDAKASRGWLPDQRLEPGEALDEFLRERPNFVNDQEWQNRYGSKYASEYLRRIR